MSEHTPGPWEYQKGNGGFIVRGIGGAVCERWPASWMPEEQERMDADGRLIAAGPKLLVACKAAVLYDEALRACADDPDKMASYCTAQGDTLDSLYADWISKAQAAIADTEEKTHA